MKTSIRSIIVAAVCMLVVVPTYVLHAQHAQCTPVFLDTAQLATLHTAYLSKTPESASQLHTLLRNADSLLAMKPLSVMDKTQTPPSGSKHDYLSMGPYWWPDTSKPDGLPYIRKDGRRNPEYNTFTDPDYFERMAMAVEKLSLSFAITSDARYSAKAAELLRVWFLDENTKMNPNMNHAQFIPGINSGRGIGIIETRRIYKILDALCLLETSREWKKLDDEQMRAWLGEYFRWLTTSPYGIDESNEKNNHGTWYNVQVVSLSLFLGKTELAGHYLDSAKIKRITPQIEPDGKQPLELARTNSWSYSVMNLSAFFHLATAADRAGIDLWHYESPRGGSIRKALEYLLPFTVNPEKWTYGLLHPIEPASLYPLLLQARQHIDKTKYSGWLKQLHRKSTNEVIEGLLD
jgi:Alginate lyase